MDYIKLGSKIRARRTELKLSQEQLAEMAFVSHQYIGQLERAERKMSLETLVSIANALNVTIDFLLSDSLTADNDPKIKQIVDILSCRSEHTKSTALDVLIALCLHID